MLSKLLYNNGRIVQTKRGWWRPLSSTLCEIVSWIVCDSCEVPDEDSSWCRDKQSRASGLVE